ncbi:uncharacterized protein LOC125650786 [Ostrea edulis]|uniref:uncharacterized protein LOC125650786 n=1 Tax=Ostrea edulis TaxID=37623 RepID=UPI0024AFDCBB|nr:uncharacterized protein LOC125650786 [Ostrea edulis]
MFHLKLVIFVGLSCAVFGQNVSQPSENQRTGTGSDCIRRVTTQVSRYFWKLQSRRIDYRERNNRIFADIPFLHLTTVYGWTMRGKSGRISQEHEDGRGIITEYMIQFLNSDGKWSYINNSKTGKEIFTNLGNIAMPDTITSISLANPVTTLVLRVIPELWDGIPFMLMSIQHCGDSVATEQRPILPLQLAHNSIKKNLEDQIKNKVHEKIGHLQQRVQQLKLKMAGQPKHHQRVQTIHHGEETQKPQSPENQRIKHRKYQTNMKNKDKKYSKHSGKHPTTQKQSGKHPTTQKQSGKHPTAQKQSGKHPTTQKQSGKHPTAQKQSGKHPTAQKQSGKHPTAQKQSGKHPTAQKQSGKHPTIQKHNGKHPTAQKQSGKHSAAQNQTKHPGKDPALQTHTKSTDQPTKPRRNTKTLQKNRMVEIHDRSDSLEELEERQSRDQNNDKHKSVKKKTRKTTPSSNHMKKGRKPANRKIVNKQNKSQSSHTNSKQTNKERTKQTNKEQTKQTNKERTKHRNKERTKHRDKHQKFKEKPKIKSAKQSQKSSGKDKGKAPHQGKKSTSLGQVSKKIDKTVKKLTQLKKQVHEIDKQSPKKSDKVNKPYTPEVTGNKSLKTESESLSSSKTKPDSSLVAMKELEKENTDLSKSVYGSCRSKPVWRYGNSVFRPDDAFSALDDSRQAWRAMYGLGIQPYRFRIPKSSQNSRNQKYYLEINFRKITNVFGLRVAGSSSQLQWGAVTKFSFYHKRRDSNPWQSYVDRLNQPRVFDVGTREKSNAHALSVFKLDVPVTAKAIRIFPERWVSEPLMVVDLLTCETSYRH